MNPLSATASAPQPIRKRKAPTESPAPEPLLSQLTSNPQKADRILNYIEQSTRLNYIEQSTRRLNNSPLTRTESGVRDRINLCTRLFKSTISRLNTIEDKQQVRRSMILLYEGTYALDRLIPNGIAPFGPELDELPFFDEKYEKRVPFKLSNIALKRSGFKGGHGRLGIADPVMFEKIRALIKASGKTVCPSVTLKDQSVLLFINKHIRNGIIHEELGSGSTKRARLAIKIDSQGEVTFFANLKSKMTHWFELRETFTEYDITTEIPNRDQILTNAAPVIYKGKKRQVSVLSELGSPLSIHTLDALLDKLPQMAAPLLILEQQGICHNDVKIQNYIVDTNGTIKLIDFGISKTKKYDFRREQKGGTFLPIELLPSRETAIAPDKIDTWGLMLTAAGLIPLNDYYVGLSQQDSDTLTQWAPPGFIATYNQTHYINTHLSISKDTGHLFLENLRTFITMSLLKSDDILRRALGDCMLGALAPAAERLTMARLLDMPLFALLNSRSNNTVKNQDLISPRAE